MAARILHLSDLHIGRREAPEPFAALLELIPGIGPELVLATGDLAHRGRREQLERAAVLLGELGARLLAVPGNHDIPYTIPARFTHTLAEWERVFGEPEPSYRSPSFTVAGLSSVRPRRQQGGALAPAQLDHAASILAGAEPGSLRVVALHHHLAAPPWRTARKRPLSDRDAVLRRLADAGAELVASGHVHQSAIAERREFEVADGPGRSLVLASVAGFGRPRPHRSGEAVGFNVYECDDATLTAVTWAWDGSSFAEVGRRTFPRR